MIKNFEEYLATEFMKEYHGDKEHYETAFEGWLENKDGNDLIQYAEVAISEIKQEFINDINQIGKILKQ